MKAAQERKALNDLRLSLRLLREMEGGLLTALSRDEQQTTHGYDGEGVADRVHRLTDAVCRNLAEIANRALVASGSVRALGVEGESDRPPLAPVCAACGCVALPRPRGGFCGACARAWDRLREKDANADRGMFIASRGPCVASVASASDQGKDDKTEGHVV